MALQIVFLAILEPEGPIALGARNFRGKFRFLDGAHAVFPAVCFDSRFLDGAHAGKVDKVKFSIRVLQVKVPKSRFEYEFYELF